MNAPLQSASDCNVHRHLAQLSVTRELFVREQKTLDRIGELGVAVDAVDAVLMYVDDEGAEFFELCDWWKQRAPRILSAIS